MPMLPRPPFLLTISMLAGLVAVSLMVVTPIGDDFWLSYIDPLSYGARLLSTAHGFALPHFDSRGCELPFGHPDAWRRIVGHPAGDSLFRHIFAEGRSGGRLYALIGLYQLRARGLPAALQSARRDTTIVWQWDWNAKRTSEVPLRKLANEDSLATWARALQGSARSMGCAA